jgi:toxin ParE1/3/4
VSGKPIVPRALAVLDIEDAVAYYLREGSERTALGFIDAVERTFSRLGHHPASGSSRYAHELNLPGLRSVQVRRHPHLVFYVERDTHIDVWRVLHGERDIPTWMKEPEGL